MPSLWPLLATASIEASLYSRGWGRRPHFWMGEAKHHIAKGVYPRSYSLGPLIPVPWGLLPWLLLADGVPPSPFFSFLTLNKKQGWRCVIITVSVTKWKGQKMPAEVLLKAQSLRNKSGEDYTASSDAFSFHQILTWYLSSEPTWVVDAREQIPCQPRWPGVVHSHPVWLSVSTGAFDFVFVSCFLSLSVACSWSELNGKLLRFYWLRGTEVRLAGVCVKSFFPLFSFPFQLFWFLPSF